jgi:hypothetical protein
VSLPQHVIAVLWTYVTETGAGLQHTKRVQQNVAYHQTRVHLVFFFHLLAKNYKGEYGEFSNDKHGKSISTIRKTQRGRVCVEHEYKIHSFILFYDAVLDATLDAILDAVLSHTPTGYFLKVLQSQVALTVYIWNHSLCPFSQKVVKVC